MFGSPGAWADLIPGGAALLNGEDGVVFCIVVVCGCGPFLNAIAPGGGGTFFAIVVVFGIAGAGRENGIAGPPFIIPVC